MNKGYIKLHRKFWDNPISRKPTYLAVFIYILSQANHKDQEIIINNEPKMVKRGQYFGSMKQVAEQFKMQRSTVKYIFDYFLKVGVISVQEKNTNFTFITINNYNQYQDSVQEYNADNTGIQLNKNVRKEECKKEKTHDQSEIDRFEFFWKQYPRKAQKSKALKKFLSIKDSDMPKFEIAFKFYLDSIAGKELQYIKQGDTFFNQWKDIYIESQEQQSTGNAEVDSFEAKLNELRSEFPGYDRFRLKEIMREREK